jgi:multidrug efflux system membrane fusion protein
MRIHSLMALALAAATAACSGGEAKSPSSGAGAGSNAAAGGRGSGTGAGRGGLNAAVPVTIAPVVQKSVPLEIQGIGTVIAATTVAVRAQITGEMTSVHFKEGEDVTQGQILVEMDKRPFQAALQQAEATLQRDIAQANNAKASAERYKDLQQRGIATKEQVDQMTTQAAALAATVNADRAAIDTAKVQLDYATIEAPISGRTGLLQVHPGNLIRAQDTIPIVTINRITPVYVSFAIPEAQLPELKRYMAQGQLQVRAQPSGDSGKPSIGRVNFIDNAVDVTTGTIKVKGTFPNEDRRLWPGQFANVTVTLSTDPHAVVVPTTAVQTGQQGTYVFVVKPDQTVELRTVNVARTRDADSVIRDGLKVGETVVTDGQIRLVPGTKVVIKGGEKAAS